MDDCVTHHICACQERKLRQLEEQIQAMQSKLQAVEQASKNNFEEYQLQGDRTIRVERESDALRAQVSEARDVCTAAEETEHQLRARIRKLEAQLAAGEFWKNWVYPDGTTAEQVQAELTDYHVILEQVGKVYMHITGGRISKPNTLAEEVIAVADEKVQEAVRDAIADFDFEDLERRGYNLKSLVFRVKKKRPTKCEN